MAISLIATASTDAASGNPTITHGLTIASGDVIVATVHMNQNGNTITDNNGSTPFTTDTYRESAGSHRYYVCHRVCGGSEPSSYTWTAGASDRWSIVLRQYRGVDTSSVWDVAPSDTTSAIEDTPGGESSPATAPSITIATAGAMGLILVAGDYAPTTTTWSGQTNSYGDEKEETGQQTQATYDRIWSSTGATGTTSVTPSANEYWVIYQVALKPADTEPTLTCTLDGIRHAYTYSIADETRTQVVHPADWLADHSIATATALNGLAPVGAVVPFAGLIANIPAGWKLCNGDSLLRAGTYADLYSAIGLTYGYADGTHFNLPDLRDKFIVGANQDDSSLPKASITGGLTQSYAPVTASLTHSITIADHTMTHDGISVAAHTMTHSIQIADHPSLQLVGTISNQATAGRVGTKTASLAVTASAHAVTWPSIAARVHTITQPDHTVTHTVTQPDAHTGGAVTHGFTVPAAHTMPVPVPAFLAIAYMIRYA